MDIETSNFENYSLKEFKENLIRLGAITHSSLVGKEVYYSQKIYGKHTILKWDADRAEFLLSLDGQKFWASPFTIKLIE